MGRTANSAAGSTASSAVGRTQGPQTGPHREAVQWAAVAVLKQGRTGAAHRQARRTPAEHIDLGKGLSWGCYVRGAAAQKGTGHGNVHNQLDGAERVGLAAAARGRH